VLKLILRFLLGNLNGLTSKDELLAIDQLVPLDRYLLHKTASYADEIGKLFDSMQFNVVALKTQHFIANDLSSEYFHFVRDRFVLNLITIYT